MIMVECYWCEKVFKVMDEENPVRTASCIGVCDSCLGKIKTGTKLSFEGWRTLTPCKEEEEKK